MFALPVVRKPGARRSRRRSAAATSPRAPAEASRLPQPYLPAGLRLDRFEGAGEVQTPLLGEPARRRCAVGDRVYFRHAKAGELCERFNSAATSSRRRGRGRGPDLPRRGPASGEGNRLRPRAMRVILPGDVSDGQAAGEMGAWLGLFALVALALFAMLEAEQAYPPCR